MAQYILHKSGKTIEIPALLEDCPDGYFVTFDKILNELNGVYTPIKIRVPGDIGAEVYTTVYGERLFRADGIPAPAARLMTYTAGGKRWAYYDTDERPASIREPDERGKDPGPGRKIRYRFEIITD